MHFCLSIKIVILCNERRFLRVFVGKGVDRVNKGTHKVKEREFSDLLIPFETEFEGF